MRLRSMLLSIVMLMVVLMTTVFATSSAPRIAARSVSVERARAAGSLALQAKADNTTVLGEVTRIREQWVRDLHAKQLDAIMLFYAPDASFLTGNGMRFTGRDAIRGLFTNVMGSVTSNLTMNSILIESSGDLAYDSGDYKETLAPALGGPTQEYEGCYVIVYKRQADGQWLIVQHAWTLLSKDVIPAGEKK
jgi:uncharacterized protein (TIGR02246 family)